MVDRDSTAQLVVELGTLRRRIAALEAAEATHRQSETALASLAKFPAENPNPILRIRCYGVLLYINEAGQTLLPEWQLAIDQPVPDLLREAVTETLSQQTHKLVETTQHDRVISFFVAPVAEEGYANLYGRNVTERKRAETAWFELSVAAMGDCRSPGLRYILLVRDITERRRAEAERERLVIELERKNKELESIVFITSHDLRSPLVNIQGFGRDLHKYFTQLVECLDKAGTLEDFRPAARPLVTERIPNALRFVEISSAKMDTLITGLLRVAHRPRSAEIRAGRYESPDAGYPRDDGLPN